MLSKKTIEAMAARLGMDITAAMADEKDMDVDVPEGKILTDAQLAERDSNTKSATIEAESKNVSPIAKAELKKRGFDVKGERWGDVVNELHGLINSDKDTKVKLLQEQNEALLADNTTYKTKITEVEGTAKKAIFEAGLISKLPKNELGLSPAESLALLRLRGYDPEQTEKGVVWKKNGEILKDGNTHAPLPEEAAITNIWGELKWNISAGGVGGRNISGTGGGGTGGIGSMSAAKKAFLEAHPGKSQISPEFTQFIEGAVKENPSFDYTS